MPVLIVDARRRRIEPLSRPLQLVKLPTEMIQRIFDLLAPLRHSEKARLCLISRGLLPFARHILYHNVEIKGDITAGAPEWQDGVYLPTESSVLLLCTLISSSLPKQRLGTLELDLSCPQGAPSWGTTTFLDIARLQQARGQQIDRLGCLLPEQWFYGDALLPLLQAEMAFALELRMLSMGPGDTTFCTASFERPLSGGIREIRLRNMARVPSTIEEWAPISILGPLITMERFLEAVKGAIQSAETYAADRELLYPLKTVLSLPAVRDVTIEITRNLAIQTQVNFIREVLADTVDKGRIRQLGIISHLPCPLGVLRDFAENANFGAIKIFVFMWTRAGLDSVQDATSVRAIEAFCEHPQQQQESNIRAILKRRGVVVFIATIDE